MTSLEDTVNYDADIVGVIQEDDMTYYVIKDHILWVDGIAELCWSVNDAYWSKSEEPYPANNLMMDPIFYQTQFDKFYYEWNMVFPNKKIMVEQE